MKSEGEPGRRHHDRALKARLVELSLQPGASASAIAREHGINANLLFTWRREFRRAETSAGNTACAVAASGVAIGRKNYLHLGSDAGGNSAAVIYTLIGSAKLNGIDPQAYLRHVLDRIADHPSNRIDKLLPWAVAGELVKATPTTSATADKLAA